MHTNWLDYKLTLYFSLFLYLYLPLGMCQCNLLSICFLSIHACEMITHLHAPLSDVCQITWIIYDDFDFSSISCWINCNLRWNYSSSSSSTSLSSPPAVSFNLTHVQLLRMKGCSCSFLSSSSHLNYVSSLIFSSHFDILFDIWIRPSDESPALLLSSSSFFFFLSQYVLCWI